MKPAVVILLMLAQGAVSPATQVLQRLQGKISVQPVRLSRTNDLAGVYSDISAELPSLSGQDLYFFPDGTYIYCEWADIEPNTVYDKGKWTVSESSLELVSDPDVRWPPKVDHRFIIVRREKKASEILLVGLSQNFGFFEELAGDTPDFALLLVSLQRTRVVPVGAARALKAKLMKDAWKPDYFR